MPLQIPLQANYLEAFMRTTRPEPRAGQDIFVSFFCLPAKAQDYTLVRFFAAFATVNLARGCELTFLALFMREVRSI